MSDYIVRATAANNQIRAFAITSKDLVEEARKRHNTSPVITAGLGRLLSGAAMMGAMMKGDEDLLTLQIKCGGPVQGLTATADAKGNVKGYAEVPDVMLPPNPQGKLDVGGALGLGILNVIKDMGLKEPYAGQVALQTGEIAEDLTYYFATSEQIPSAVGLGVLMNKDNTVRQAGGFIIQLLPFTDEKIRNGDVRRGNDTGNALRRDPWRFRLRDYRYTAGTVFLQLLQREDYESLDQYREKRSAGNDR